MKFKYICLLIGVFVIGLFFFLAVFSSMRERSLDNFCKENLYERGRYNLGTFMTDSWCEKSDGKGRIIRLIKRCNGLNWCFVDFGLNETKEVQGG